MFRIHRRRSSRIAIGFLLIGIAVSVSACSPNAANPAAGPTSSAGASANASGPVLVPDGTAKENQPFFDSVNQALLVKTANPGGRGFIDSLVDAGFTKKDMEVTPDKTAIGLDRDNIQFSVKFGNDCIIGQFGNVGYHSTIAPATQTDTCLVGTTRAIDW